jgi:hypothetical protein
MASNIIMISGQHTERMLKEVVDTYCMFVSYHYSGVTEYDHEKPQL